MIHQWRVSSLWNSDSDCFTLWNANNPKTELTTTMMRANDQLRVNINKVFTNKHKAAIQFGFENKLSVLLVSSTS